MAKTIVDGQKIDLKLKTRYPQIEFDKLKIYCGEPYVIDLESAHGSIIIDMPKVGNIISFGEKKFNETLSVFISNTTSHRLFLWDNGIDWNEISDFDLFCILYKNLNPSAVSLIFKDFNFEKFELRKKLNEDGEQVVVLYDEEDDIEINEEVYQHIHQYLQAVFNIVPEEKITQDKTLKELYIRKDRSEYNRKKDKDSSANSIQSLISSCVNHPGFKYKLSELKELGVAEFYDSVKRLQIYESSTALMKGMYSGFVDSSKINSNDYNFMKEI